MEVLIVLGIYFLLGVVSVAYIEPVHRAKGFSPASLWLMLWYTALWPLYVLAFLINEAY